MTKNRSWMTGENDKAEPKTSEFEKSAGNRKMQVGVTGSTLVATEGARVLADGM